MKESCALLGGQVIGVASHISAGAAGITVGIASSIGWHLKDQGVCQRRSEVKVRSEGS